MCKRLIALSLLLLLAFSSTSFGQTITIQQTQYDNLKRITVTLKQDLQLLSTSLTISIKDLNEVKQRLSDSDKQLQNLLTELQLSQNENKEIRKLLDEALTESQNLKALLTKLEDKNKSLKQQRNAGIAFGIIGILLAIFH